MRISKLLTIVLTMILSIPMMAQPSNWGNVNRWESLNPGGGGQIQDIYFDQNVDGRIWFSSDMEGVYRSDNYGQSWTYVSKDLSHGMAFVIAQEHNGSKTYQGGLHGAHSSPNGGAANPQNVTWDLIPETKGDAIASIGISANNQTVVLAPGWQNKDPQKGQGALIDPIQNLTTDKFNGPREVYVSTNAGSTWNTVKYDNQNGYRNIFGVSIHQGNGNIYLGAAAGVYVSTNNGSSFNRISDPSGALGDPGNASTIAKRPDGGSRGVCLSPDGKFIYAVYQTVASSDYANKRWAVYVAKTSANGITGGWQQIMNGLSGESEWYDPKVDPRSTSTKHRVLLGTVWNSNQNRVGLWEATVNINGSNQITSHSWQEVLNLPKNGRCYDYEPSWESRDFIVRAYDYTPTSWSSHQIISMGGMNVFLGNANGADFPCSSWNEVYGEVISSHNGVVMSHERGFSSPYCYDVDSYDSYMIQGNADHGILQSLDNGYSWTSEEGPQGITNSMSVLTIPVNPPLVLADMRKGYGAPNQAVGGIYAKVIDLNDIGTKDSWRLVGGAVPNNQGTTYGLPSRNFRAMVHDPSIPQRVYVSTRGKSGVAEGGVYITDNIVAVYNGNGSWRKITPSSMDLLDLRDVWVDPNNSNYVYVRSAGTGTNASLFRGVRSGSSYNWTDMQSVMKNADDLYAWNKSGQTWLVAAGEIAGQYGVFICDAPRNSGWGNASSWSFTGMDIDESLTLRPEKWVEPNEPIEFSGLAAYNDQIIVTTSVPNHKKGLGAFTGKINSNGSVSWSDWSLASGNNRLIENPTSLQAKIKIENNKPYYYVALAGTGAWRRQVSAPPATCSLNTSKSSHNFGSSSGSTNVNITTSGSFTVNDNAGFITTSVSGNTVTISVAANTSSSSRSGVVTISGCQNKTISISQDGENSPPPSGDGGMEDFSLMPVANQWSDGSYIGNDGIEWTYFKVKRTNTINDNTIKLDNSAGAYVSADISGGLTALNFAVSPTGTGSDSGVDVIVNGTTIQSFFIPKASAPQTFSVDNLDINGTFELRFEGYNNSDVQIDDITWVGQSQSFYTLVVNSGSGDGDYLAGTSINISANAAPAGKEFDRWTGGVSNVANVNAMNTTLTMPTNGVTVTATYKDIVSTGGMEDFNNMPTANEWSTGSFVGNDGITWNYVNVKRTNTINGNTMKLDNDANGEISATLAGPINTLTFNVAPTGTAQMSGVEVFANGVSIGTADIQVATQRSVTFQNVSTASSVVLSFKGYNNADVQIDDITWSGSGGSRNADDQNAVVSEKLIVFPNPTSDFISINSVQPVDVRIFDLNGMLLIRQTLTDNQKIDISSFKTGLYIIQAGGEVFRVIKQ